MAMRAAHTQILLYCIYLLSAISPRTTGLKVPSDCASAAQLSSY